MQDARIIIEFDPDTEDPCECYQWKIFSFSKRHRNYVNPDELDPRIRRKIANGTAFILSYYEHGNCVWSLQGEGPHCQWDSVDVAGVMVWEGKLTDMGKTPAKRKKAARSFLESYTDWCNGRCYQWRVETLDGEEINSCSRVIGWDWLEKMVKDECPDVRIVEAEGEAADVFTIEDA